MAIIIIKIRFVTVLFSSQFQIMKIKKCRQRRESQYRINRFGISCLGHKENSNIFALISTKSNLKTNNETIFINSLKADFAAEGSNEHKLQNEVYSDSIT